MNRTYLRPPRPSANQMNQRAMQLFAEMGRAPTVAAYRDWGNLYVRRAGEPLIDNCGTAAGHRQHRREGTEICAGCRTAADNYAAAYNAAKRKSVA